ncbi:MAG: hypothetical protein ACU4EQ_12940 [Candidatus Nitrosoglobus sp.]
MKHPQRKNRLEIRPLYELDEQAKKILKSLSKESLRKAVETDAKMFRANKLPVR